MKNIKKEDAIVELQNLISQIDPLKNVKLFSSEHSRWILNVNTFLDNVFGRNSKYFSSFSGLSWHETGPMVLQFTIDVKTEVDKQHQRVYLERLELARGILLSALDQLKMHNIDEVYEGKDTAPESSLILKVISLGEKKLRKLIREKPNNEKEIQNKFEDLLIGADIPYDRESDKIIYSSKTYTPDFTIKKIDLSIEIKFCFNEGREKSMIPEINDDILAYQTKYGNIIFFIYDLGYIRDIERFSESFEQNQNVYVRVIKH